MHARGSGEAARRAKLGREPIRVGGGLKKNFRPFGPQFGLKIRKNKGGGPPGSRPSPGSFTVDRRAGIFNDYRFIWENSRFSLLGGLLLAENPTKAFHWWRAEKPPIFKGDASRTLRMCNILKSIQPVYPPIFSHAEVLRSSLRARSYSCFSVPSAHSCTQTCIN